MSPASYQTAPPRDDCALGTIPANGARACTDSTFWRAGNGTRTRDPNLGKVVLYQLSYSREIGVGTKETPTIPQPRLPLVKPGPTLARHHHLMEARGIEPLTS